MRHYQERNAPPSDIYLQGESAYRASGISRPDATSDTRVQGGVFCYLTPCYSLALEPAEMSGLDSFLASRDVPGYTQKHRTIHFQPEYSCCHIATDGTRPWCHADYEKHRQQQLRIDTGDHVLQRFGGGPFYKGTTFPNSARRWASYSRAPINRFLSMISAGFHDRLVT